MDGALHRVLSSRPLVGHRSSDQRRALTFAALYFLGLPAFISTWPVCHAAHAMVCRN